MKASEIRRRFLDYFGARDHQILPSAPLVPGDDPTLLFTNAGMVPFKRVFLGEERPDHPRATTSQKCVRAGGKHNDLEQVGVTARHHTFFEMLGNFSFGDYFKRDAVAFAWEFLTVELGLDPERLYASVHHTDDEAFALWIEIAGLPAERIFRLGDRDNFWQMADTGPCGPCSELHYDLRPEGERSVPSLEELEVLGESGQLLELWNLVFMQFDRDAEGTLHPLPAPSIDTGAGLERLAAVMQGVSSNYHSDLFLPLLDRVASAVGRPYQAEGAEGVSYRVLADHARAVTFLLADGVFPANEGRGYVLRRILRRAVRHAWLLGKREPVLVEVVDAVISTMGESYPELIERRVGILRTTRAEEERFLATIEGGMARFDELAPEASAGPRTIPGREVFRLYDTFGFPLDLTEVMAGERGYVVDLEGFEAALEEQRVRSRQDRASAMAPGRGGEGGEWVTLVSGAEQRWVGWEHREVETRLLALLDEGSSVGLILEENPFYLEAGGQISDVGAVTGPGWSVRVDELRRIEGKTALFGPLEGDLPSSGFPPSSEGTKGGVFQVRAIVDRVRRLDTERNHTATHLLHAALRELLGDHVAQKGSLVTPERLRFDFSHPQPLRPEELEAIEARVNEAIWADHPVRWELTTREAAVARGAMALFGEKYGSEVRVVEIPGVSLELCGGNHLAHTGAAGSFAITRESGVAAGVRRIEALTGPAAYRRLRESEVALEQLSERLRAPREVLLRRVDQLLEERVALESLVDELRSGGGGSTGTVVLETQVDLGGEGHASYRGVRLRVRDAEDARQVGDAFRRESSRGVLALGTEGGEGKAGLFVFVTDDLLPHGVRAGAIVAEMAAAAGGRGGGKPHMAQGGIDDPGKLDLALQAGGEALRRLLSGVAGG